MNLTSLGFIAPVEQRISRYTLIHATFHGTLRVEADFKNLEEVKIC
tara:strand:+ start:295 stop:432 length:138 start_codon:yes stop_codon:yes gene_type:complete